MLARTPTVRAFPADYADVVIEHEGVFRTYHLIVTADGELQLPMPCTVSETAPDDWYGNDDL